MARLLFLIVLVTICPFSWGQVCPAEIQCAQPPELREKPVYELEPSIVTHSKTHVEAVQRPTVTVWVDTTTTAHFYKDVVETEELTHTYTVTPTSACIKEIDSLPTPAPKFPPKPQGQGSGPLGKSFKDVIKEGTKAGAKAGAVGSMGPLGSFVAPVADKLLDDVVDDVLGEVVEAVEEAADNYTDQIPLSEIFIEEDEDYDE
ncbi:hypothetical protein N7462_004335 [Penicillium macrosclerotiorum]|uniref:uncharacterized protein n=1 Tax=Penicillium macrosclerotiorum TaxID=303699 RepID=UPI0025468E48|nr:uncharacterized protein N7462_004335 [Penicillium macrosclerotiorum]KAJ5689943.1 hypothetical protein N7462_004335 [Penicillium macrosclerotiorum]